MYSLLCLLCGLLGLLRLILENDVQFVQFYLVVKSTFVVRFSRALVYQSNESFSLQQQIFSSFCTRLSLCVEVLFVAPSFALSAVVVCCLLFLLWLSLSFLLLL